MAETKTKPSDVSPDLIIDQAEPAGRREDARILKEIMDRVTGEEAVVWGPTMIGYGSYHYTYESGHSGDAIILGFSPRKASMSIYGLQMWAPEGLIEQLGKVKLGKDCIWAGRFSSLNLEVLEELVRIAWSKRKELQAMFPADA
ncbi:DUF1801 domain-containing protein [Pseudoclavibacter sp. RFBB5]|uniref:DUF1801 domain-containing protein n=1 Tax=Pseudoclavibacter sp. RFBB5 TaxID=2080574 RepID=UPI000CE8D931|nr:DUF1801 domain-containing protein [Pseudoclavibacter sp. RFBB5]PPG27979.1 hypothetical protein C5B97_13935 [Pseudoclavibacter sp. RFBB5]